MTVTVHLSVTFKKNIMKIIEGNLAKNLIVIGNWSDKDGI